jgi:hypothetical protein
MVACKYLILLGDLLSSGLHRSLNSLCSWFYFIGAGGNSLPRIFGVADACNVGVAGVGRALWA